MTKRRYGGGRKAAVVPAGDGKRQRLSLGFGSSVFESLRKQWPGLSQADLIRAAVLEATGHSALPFQQAVATFTPEEQEAYEGLLAQFVQAGLHIQVSGDFFPPLGERLELAWRQLGEQPNVGMKAGTQCVQKLMHAQKEARDRRLIDANNLARLSFMTENEHNSRTVYRPAIDSLQI